MQYKNIIPQNYVNVNCKIRYYDYNNECIYAEKVKDEEYCEIDTDYCKKECYYALIFIEDYGKMYYSKFTRY